MFSYNTLCATASIYTLLFYIQTYRLLLDASHLSQFIDFQESDLYDIMTHLSLLQSIEIRKENSRL